MTHDTSGRPYARLSELKAGDVVIVDDGFDCMARWSERVVHLDPEATVDDDRFQIPCTHKWHNLSGQLTGTDDALTGIYHRSVFVDAEGVLRVPARARQPRKVPA